MRAISIAAGVAFAAAAAGGCNHERVVLELAGSAGGAQRVEVILLEPRVIPKLQRRNDRGSTTPRAPNELVYYMAQRASVGFELELGGEALDGMQLEVRDTGGPYVPLVVVRGELDTEVLALGLYSPGSVFEAKAGTEHRPDAVDRIDDVTIYSIQLEPVVKTFGVDPEQPIGQARQTVMGVRCPGGAQSGAVWRRAEDQQLRVLQPLGGGTGSAVDRLDAPDLDCDHHTPGGAERAGDQLDCDDTAFTIHAEAEERCSGFDEDCNAATTLTVIDDPNNEVCVCDDANPTGTTCAAGTHPYECKIPGEPVSGGLRPCSNAQGALEVAACIGSQQPCTATLVHAPAGWDVRIGEAGARVGEPTPVSLDGRLRLLARSGLTFPPFDPVGVIGVRIAPPGGPAALHVMRLHVVSPGEVCTVGLIVCTPL